VLSVEGGLGRVRLKYTAVTYNSPSNAHAPVVTVVKRLPVVIRIISVVARADIVGALDTVGSAHALVAVIHPCVILRNFYPVNFTCVRTRAIHAVDGAVLASAFVAAVPPALPMFVLFTKRLTPETHIANKSVIWGANAVTTIRFDAVGQWDFLSSVNTGHFENLILCLIIRPFFYIYRLIIILGWSTVQNWAKTGEQENQANKLH